MWCGGVVLCCVVFCFAGEMSVLLPLGFPITPPPGIANRRTEAALDRDSSFNRDVPQVHRLLSAATHVMFYQTKKKGLTKSKE